MFHKVHLTSKKTGYEQYHDAIGIKNPTILCTIEALINLDNDRLIDLVSAMIVNYHFFKKRIFDKDEKAISVEHYVSIYAPIRKMGYH